MSTDTTAPDTIVLVHGLWMTPRSWEEWVPYYERKGYKVITPTYPGFEVEVAALREDPTPIATATVPATVAHIADAITGSTLRRSSWATRSGGHSPSSSSTAAAVPPRRDRLRADRRRARVPAFADQVALPCS